MTLLNWNLGLLLLVMRRLFLAPRSDKNLTTCLFTSFQAFKFQEFGWTNYLLAKAIPTPKNKYTQAPLFASLLCMLRWALDAKLPEPRS